MKDIRTAIRTLLLSDPTVNGLVGGNRVYPIAVPQGVLDPSVVYNRITEGGDYHMAGDSGLLATRMQLDSWGQSADLSNNLAGAVHDCVSGFRGVEGTVEIQGIFMLNGRDEYDSAAKMYRMSRDYEVWYR